MLWKAAFRFHWPLLPPGVHRVSSDLGISQPNWLPHSDKGTRNFLILIQAPLSFHFCPMMYCFRGTLTVGILFLEKILPSLWEGCFDFHQHNYINTFCKISFIHIWMILCMGFHDPSTKFRLLFSLLKHLQVFRKKFMGYGLTDLVKTEIEQALE